MNGKLATFLAITFLAALIGSFTYQKGLLAKDQLVTAEKEKAYELFQAWIVKHNVQYRELEVLI